MEGVGKEDLPDTRFVVGLSNGHDIVAYMCGKMRKHRIRLLAGDRVSVKLTPYDWIKGRITFVHKNERAQCLTPAGVPSTGASRTASHVSTTPSFGRSNSADLEHAIPLWPPSLIYGKIDCRASEPFASQTAKASIS